ncbi:MAG: hypothetical protein ACM368_08350 [Gemmatimonadota bacterium]
MRRRAAGCFAVALAACGNPAEPHGTGRVRLAVQGTTDTVRFEVPVIAQRCAGGGGVLVTGAREGQGVLLLLRSATPAIDTGSYALLTRADSAALRGAIVAIRFSVGPTSHGLTVDDGTARVSRTAPTLAAGVRGHGVETGTAVQRTADLTVDDVPLAPDSAYCRVQP